MPSCRTLFRELNSRPDADRTLALLKDLALQSLAPEELGEFHEQVLFSKAYPRSPEIHNFCTRELRWFAARMAGLEDEDQCEFDQTGIVGTRIFYPYDFETARWLQARLKERIDVDWEAYGERDHDPLGGLLPHLTTRAEADALDDESASTPEFIRAACAGNGTSLAWILDGFARAYPAGIREHLYNSMQLSLTVELDRRGPSRTLLDDGRPDELFIWDPLAARQKFDLVAEVKRPLHIPPPVGSKRGRELLNLAFGTLLPRLRELYPLTHANDAEVYDIRLERGIRAVVWFMRPEFRLPLEVGWGLLLLKNNVPIGYGAGGMLAERSEIAINVFDTFRGGEAAWLYSQYARVFHAFCRAPWLVTRRYQIGHENEEGIASGAYWFWDKLGFRSTDPEIRRLADAERKKIARGNGYRTPRRLLRKLAQADVALSLEGRPPEKYEEYPLGKVGQLATRVIAETLDGNRRGLEGRVLRLLREKVGLPLDGLTGPERVSVAQMGLLLLSIPGLDKWPKSERERAMELFRLKGSLQEADYARALGGNSRFFDALARQARSLDESTRRG
ncbi:hypothetical protein KKH27_10705 [bacterium]|nr:hypothetical protein [bacterium]